ncbi:MAG: hypothetical protein ACRYF4_05385 [Janthinobacterium lividum]
MGAVKASDDESGRNASMPQPDSTISYDWMPPSPSGKYATGVSLHSHTSHSVESLMFIHSMFVAYPAVKRLFSYYEKRSERHGVTVDFVAAHWRPPLLPRMALDLESQQIRELGLRPLVSLTDHDDVLAPLLLRTMRSSRKVPVSVEWTVPFGQTVFHIGIHNLPAEHAMQWMARFEAFTAAPCEQELHGLLSELHSDPRILIILNHPLWDLYETGELHCKELTRFLETHNERVHALELNGLRHPKENRQVTKLARTWSQLLISGGDRHGMEANANINLTDARTFDDFVHEVRVERRSHVLFLQQYRQPWSHRIMNSTVDSITNHSSFSEGWQRWDERAFHPDRNGIMQPLSDLWTGGRAPLPLRAAITVVRLSRHRTVAHLLDWMLPKIDAGTANAIHQEIA